MDLRSTLSQRCHKETSHQIARYIGSDQGRFSELMELVLGDDDQLSKYSAWVVQHCLENNPQLIEPHLEAMIQNLGKSNLNDSVVRSTVKALAETEIPEYLQGRVLQLCFDYLLDPKVAVAIRVHAMQAIFNISKNEPDLLMELLEVILEWMPYGSAGFNSRGRKILKDIGKILK
jgi:hypothetical protein